VVAAAMQCNAVQCNEITHGCVCPDQALAIAQQQRVADHSQRVP
jgi:hypothetical protein